MPGRQGGAIEKTMHVAIFDSGVGGLTVLADALQAMPGDRFTYYADTDQVPYGCKTRAQVRERVVRVVSFIAALGIDALVVACNTATSAAVVELRRRFPFPVIGMEPAVKPALARTGENGGNAAGEKRVLVAATPLTLREEKFQRLVETVDREGLVDPLPLPELVDFAERGEFTERKILPYLQDRLAPFDLANYGTVVLGCTHFLFFRRHFRLALPPGIDLIDGNQGTVNQLRRTLAARRATHEEAGERAGERVTYFESDRRVTDPAAIARFASLLRRYEDDRDAG